MKNLLHQDQIDELKIKLSHVFCPLHPTRPVTFISLKKNAQQKKGCLDCKIKNKLEDPIDFQIAIDELIEAQQDLRDYLDNTLNLHIQKTLPEMQQKLIQSIEIGKSNLMQQRAVLQNKINLDKIQDLYRNVKVSCRENHFDELYDFTIQWFEKSNDNFQVKRSETYENIKLESKKFMFGQIEKIKNNMSQVFDEFNSITQVINVNLGQKEPIFQQPQIPGPGQEVGVNHSIVQQYQKFYQEVNQNKVDAPDSIVKQDQQKANQTVIFNLPKQQKSYSFENFSLKFQTSEDLTIKKILLPQLSEAEDLKVQIQFNLNLNSGPYENIRFKQQEIEEDVWYQLKSPLIIKKNKIQEIKLQKVKEAISVHSYLFKESIQINHFRIEEALLDNNKYLILRGFEYTLDND